VLKEGQAMVDREGVEPSLGPVWSAAGRRIAAAAGAAMALVTLLNDLPVRVAALRGGLVLGAVLVVTHLSGLALRRLDHGTRRLETTGRSRT
jgi:hypothetical protein